MWRNDGESNAGSGDAGCALQGEEQGEGEMDEGGGRGVG